MKTVPGSVLWGGTARRFMIYEWAFLQFRLENEPGVFGSSKEPYSWPKRIISRVRTEYHGPGSAALSGGV